MHQLTHAFIPSPRWWHRPVARLLWLANSDAGRWDDADRYGFYRLKSRFLQTHAQEDGVDWQELKHHCWSCDGTGTWGYWRDGGGDWCWKCNGTGVHAVWYVRLQRYRLDRYTFHVPGERLTRADYEARIPVGGGAVVLVGKLPHTHIGRRAVASYWLLCLLFDRRQSWRLIRSVLADIESHIRRWLPRRCYDCGRVLWTPRVVAARGQGLAWCKNCAAKIPF